MMSNKELLVKMKNAANNSIVNNRKGLELYYMGKLQAFMEVYSKDLADYYIFSDIYDHKVIFDGIRKGVLPPHYIKYMVSP